MTILIMRIRRRPWYPLNTSVTQKQPFPNPVIPKISPMIAAFVIVFPLRQYINSANDATMANTPKSQGGNALYQRNPAIIAI